VITDLRESTFFANIFLDGGQGSISVDARPSDSIAIALRSHAPIFIMDFLFDKSAQTAVTEEPEAEKSPEAKAEELRRYLEELRPEDFGGQWKSEDL
jgi:bifunctional DNase/RNase